jgi:hypothetical protein
MRAMVAALSQCCCCHDPRLRGRGQAGPIGLSPSSREFKKRDEREEKRDERKEKRDEREEKRDERFSKSLPEKGHVPQFAKQ